MFFLETSGRSWLTPREACALESAVTSSHLRVNIIFLTEFVDLYDNSTCAIFKLLPNVSFFTIKLRDAFVDTPLHRFYQREDFRKSLFKASIHLILESGDLGRVQGHSEPVSAGVAGQHQRVFVKTLLTRVVAPLGHRADVELEAAPVVGRDVNVHINGLAHGVHSPDHTIAKLSSCLQFLFISSEL